MNYYRITNYIFALAFGLLALNACEKVIEDFDFLESDPKLVVNAPFIADSTILIHISHTVGIMEDDKINFVNNAIAELYLDDVLLSTASYVDSGLYVFDVFPLATYTYVLKVVSPDYPSTSAIIEMPAIPALESIEYLGWDDYGTMLDLTINDPEEYTNFYGLSMQVPFGWFEYDDFGIIIDTTIENIGYPYLMSSDINVSGGFWDYTLSTEVWDDYFDGTTLLIEDAYVNGREFSVSITAQELYFAIMIEQPVTVFLEAYNEDYIKYQRSMELYSNSIDNPIAEKVTLFSNITGGLGVAYGKTITKLDFTLPSDALDGYKPNY